MPNRPENPHLPSDNVLARETQQENLLGADLKRSTISAFVPSYDVYSERILEQDEKSNLLQKVNELAIKLENLVALGEGDKFEWSLEIKPRMSKKQEEFELDFLMSQNSIEPLKLVGDKYYNASIATRQLVKYLSAEELEDFKNKCEEIDEQYGARSRERHAPMKELERQMAEKLLKRMKTDFRRASANVKVKVIDSKGDMRVSFDNITIVTDEGNVFLKYEDPMNLGDAAVHIAQYLNDELKKAQE